MRKLLVVRSRRMKFREKTPFYSVLDCFLDTVKKQPHKPFILFEDQVHSFLQVDQASNKVAQALQLHAGSTVALLLENGPVLVWMWLGLFKLGCPVSMLNTNIRTKSLLHCFRCCGASVLIAGAEHREAVCEVLPDLLAEDVRVYILGDAGGMEGLHSLTEKIQQSPNTPVPHTLRDNITMSSTGLLIYTSGTTGFPKATLLPQDKIWAAPFFPYLTGVKADDVLYIPLPLYHGAGLLIGLAGAIERGITVVLRRKFSVSQFWNDCRKYNVTVIQYIGEIMRYLCNTPKADSDRVHNVRLAFGNGIRADTWEEFLQRFGDVRVCECYGATEGNIGFVNYVGKIGAMGRVNLLMKKASPFALIKYDTEKEEPTRDSRGFCVEVSTGETGLLVSKITKVAPFTGYANNQQQTDKKKLRNVFEEGDVYFNSGDLLKIDHEGFVYFQDRIGDTFRWKGENVATTEVADVLIMLDFIEEANVYGVKVPGHEGRIGMSAVKVMEGRDFDGSVMFEHVESLLPAYARPRFIRIQGAIDLTGTFKQMKVKLSEEGFNPTIIRDTLYFLDDKKKTYIPMTEEIFNSISDGRLRL